MEGSHTRTRFSKRLSQTLRPLTSIRWRGRKWPSRSTEPIFDMQNAKSSRRTSAASSQSGECRELNDAVNPRGSAELKLESRTSSGCALSRLRTRSTPQIKKTYHTSRAERPGAQSAPISNQDTPAYLGKRTDSLTTSLFNELFEYVEPVKSTSNSPGPSLDFDLADWNKQVDRYIARELFRNWWKALRSPPPVHIHSPLCPFWEVGDIEAPRRQCVTDKTFTRFDCNPFVVAGQAHRNVLNARDAVARDNKHSRWSPVVSSFDV
ncbi:hypothetical protein BDV95DRAFT_63916 [Massariosphaeria phaeospora]|uniref:Uncharacterized protein n=1 Tax=Massariosphaeria phaeospora TaxID=100035 RepID=A0A7C8ICG1_9PLEO|nr:hypothetical protein BDV95DRAFT_63916 [Massariosphaeria phaeospora]